MLKKYSDLLLDGLTKGPDSPQYVDEKKSNNNEIEIEGDKNGSDRQD